ncbi:MAG TPA: response regulator [Pseudolabrys sp.]|nr:response regulator [Pseudolabrys sp.]
MARQENNSAKPVVVVVDDDPAVCNALKFSLEVEGFAVRAYGSGTDALKDANSLAAVCMVVDQNMPGLSGLDLVETLSDGHVTMPTILITTHPSQIVIERARKAGIPIVEKPLLGNVLLDAVKNASARAGTIAKSA